MARKPNPSKYTPEQKNALRDLLKRYQGRFFGFKALTEKIGASSSRIDNFVNFKQEQNGKLYRRDMSDDEIDTLINELKTFSLSVRTTLNILSKTEQKEE